MRKSGLPPAVDENTEILILGTLPSDKSLAAGQYYATPETVGVLILLLLRINS